MSADEGGHHGSTAVLAALAANLAIAAAKLVGFLITRSGSMLAESIHSLADSGNQVLLLAGAARSNKPESQRHPFGYARENYLAAMTVAIVLFLGGSGFAAREGWDKLHRGHSVEAPLVAVAILVFGLLAEGFSLRTAVRQANPLRRGRSWLGFVRHTRTSELIVVLLEDTAALVGLGLALVGVALTAITGDAVFDALGTIGIAILLAIIAILLAVEVRSLLVGEAADPADEARIVDELEAIPQVSRVIHLRTEHVGPQVMVVNAKVAVDPAVSIGELSPEIDAAEARIRRALPSAKYITVEPDVFDPAALDPDHPAIADLTDDP